MTNAPNATWPTGEPVAEIDRDRLAAVVAAGTDGRSASSQTCLALLVVHRGVIVSECYSDDTDADTPLISWSMAKSMVQAVVAMLAEDGLIELDGPAPVAEWRNDGRAEITVRQLLRMRSGLRWVEDYVDHEISDVMEMLFGAGRSDVAAFAAAQPAEHPPGHEWVYSSGTTNILSRLAGQAIGGQEALDAYVRERLFDAIAMTTAQLRFDDAGTWIGSSYVYATARDFARFGYLYAHDGRWNDRQVVPSSAVADAQRTHATDPDSGQGYSEHWWTFPDLPGTFGANGYEGQRIQVDPVSDLVIVRLGKTPAEHGGELRQLYRDLIACFRGVG